MFTYSQNYLLNFCFNMSTIVIPSHSIIFFSLKIAQSPSSGKQRASAYENFVYFSEVKFLGEFVYRIKTESKSLLRLNCSYYTKLLNMSLELRSGIPTLYAAGHSAL